MSKLRAMKKSSAILKKLLVTAITLLGSLVANQPAAGQATSVQSPISSAGSAAAERAVLDRYCVACHNDKARTANLSLQGLDIASAGDHPELWEKVVRKLRAGVMPPPGMRRPP